VGQRGDLGKTLIEGKERGSAEGRRGKTHSLSNLKAFRRSGEKEGPLRTPDVTGLKERERIMGEKKELNHINLSEV